MDSHRSKPSSVVGFLWPLRIILLHILLRVHNGLTWTSDGPSEEDGASTVSDQFNLVSVLYVCLGWKDDMAKRIGHPNIALRILLDPVLCF